MVIKCHSSTKKVRIIPSYQSTLWQKVFQNPSSIIPKSCFTLNLKNMTTVDSGLFREIKGDRDELQHVEEKQASNYYFFKI